MPTWAWYLVAVVVVAGLSWICWGAAQFFTGAFFDEDDDEDDF